MNNVVVYISFSTPYAGRQHEDTRLRHPNGGQAKYLEQPFLANQQKIMRLVELRVKKALQEAR